MSRKSRGQDLRAIKDRRMKRVAAGGAVLLAVVLVFEVPKVLNSGGSSATPPAATTATTATSASTPTVNPTGTAAAALAPTTGGTRLPNSDVAPMRSKTQLYSFSHFAGKDPFAQQLSASATSPTTTTGGASMPTATVASSVSGSPAQQSSAARQVSARILATTGAATISVNGKLQSIRTGASFPSSNPLFKLVSVARGVARIGIANGSYASGAQTISLAAGRTVTLVDTADGVRYKLELVSAS